MDGAMDRNSGLLIGWRAAAKQLTAAAGITD
jgi:hypothetical protein